MPPYENPNGLYVFGSGCSRSEVRIQFRDLLHQHNRKGQTEWGPPLFEALIANSMLACVMLMCFYIGTAQRKKVQGWA